MNDQQLLRYSRHILLDEIGIEGQERILAAHVLIIGAGGLGSPAALYLGSAGVGHITLVDDDAVDLTNLQRQIAHTSERVGQPKVTSAAEAVLAINPDAAITCIQARADAALLDGLVATATVVLDCTDNYATRHAINATPNRWLWAQRFALTGKSPWWTSASQMRHAMPAYLRPTKHLKRSSARLWGYLRRWWASSARRRQLRRSS